ncbi:succinylglutamate desuccinylase/aspartoacylase domain-containing protein [Aquamicrobium terrae]|uniref:Deacylase n=1 Tax=Aquamicrobium terrae TaxID=1324945 RepID=A0ABV2N4K1_9HYPH
MNINTWAVKFASGGGDSIFPTIAEVVSATAPGQTRIGQAVIGTFASGMPILIPVMVARASEPGPTLWLNGAVHGDELNGVLASVDFFQCLEGRLEKGAVIVTPICNPVALDARRKRVPQDELDLDQNFPGRVGGSMSQRLAYALFEGIRAQADVVVNFHTMNPYFESEPYAVYKGDASSGVSEQELLGMVGCFSPFVACRMITSSAGELPGDNSGALDYQVLNLGKAAFMVELGGGSRQVPVHIDAGREGLERLAARMGLLAGDGVEPGRRMRRVTRRTHVFSERGGFFRQHASAGSLLRTGESLGEIQDFAGRLLQRVTYDQDVLVIGIRLDPVVHTGDRIGFIALEWEEIDV